MAIQFDAYRMNNIKAVLPTSMREPQGRNMRIIRFSSSAQSFKRRKKCHKLSVNQ